MKPNLLVKTGRLKLKNPVMVASGTFGEEYEDLVDIRSLGALVTKTITLRPGIGNPPPRLAETASGILNSIGLENKGLDSFIDEKLPRLRRFKVPLIVSIAGDDAAEFKELSKRLDKTRQVDAIELNLSCPNIRYGSRERLIAQDEAATHKVVAAVRKATRLTIISKLSPNVTDITKIAKAAEEAGSDALTLANTFLGMAVDIETKKPRLGNITGGLSGPAIKPLALKMIWETYKKVKIPIIGVGGIMNYQDAIEYILCGATAIQVGTANFVNPKVTIEIIKGIKEYLVMNEINNINRLIGKLKLSF